MDPVAAVGLAGGAVLALVWALANRGHLRRRRRRAEEWSGAPRPELWTSAARCPECGAGGGLVEDADEGVRFTCLACGATHRRGTRG